MYVHLKDQVEVMKDNLSNFYHLTLAFPVFPADIFFVIQQSEFEDLQEVNNTIKIYKYSKLNKKQYKILGKFISFLFLYKIPSHKILQVEFQTISGLEIVFIDNKVTNNLLS